MTTGIIQYNKGTKCIVRSIICMESLRKWWDGPVTMFLEKPYPKQYEKVLKKYNIDIIHSDNPDTGTMVRSIELCKQTPYDKTMWLDTDTLITGKIDEMFDYLDDYEVAIPHFAGWWSDGKGMSKRIKRYEDKCPKEWIDKALEHNPAINCGVFTFRKDTPYLDEWLKLAKKGDGNMFIPDEVAFQVIYPRHPEVFIAPMKYNVSVKHDPDTKDKRIIHYHGQKHVLDVPNCRPWKNALKEMKEDNTGYINEFLHLADKRLKTYMGDVRNVTIVTACDPKYIDYLKLTFPNWRKYKKIDRYPVIVFVNGMKLDDSRLDFLRLNNVELIPWEMKEIEDHREEMLSAFVLGTAKHVKTRYWLKLDSDSFATNYRPFITEEMKDYVFCGHRWGYSWAKHIKKLDKWASKHWKGTLKKAKPMYDENCVKGRRYYHPGKRTISFIQLQSTRFTKYCVKMCDGKRLPVPSHDTYLYYIADRFGSKFKFMNFKRDYGFDQGKGMDHIKKRLNEVDEANAKSEKTKQEEPVSA